MVQRDSLEGRCLRGFSVSFTMSAHGGWDGYVHCAGTHFHWSVGQFPPFTSSAL